MSFYWLSVTFILLPTLISGQVKSSNKTSSTWTPSNDGGTISVENLEALCGFKRSRSKNSSRPLSMSSLPGTKVMACDDATCLPKYFSWLDAKERCPSLGQIRTQRTKCGDCWAVATAAIISDRHCLHTKENRIFSALEISRCSITDGGCHGGDPKDAIDYYKQHGVVTGGDPTIGDQRAGCQPYFNAPNRTACEPKCNLTYDISYEQDKRIGDNGYQITSRNVDDIKIDLFRYGPLVATFDVYDDFGSYKYGIYQRHSSKLKGGHAVRLLGWGEENDVPYWLCANSWGVDWGEDGFFRIILGKNECNIEDYLHGVQTRHDTATVQILTPFITVAPLDLNEPILSSQQITKMSSTITKITTTVVTPAPSPEETITPEIITDTVTDYVTDSESVYITPVPGQPRPPPEYITHAPEQPRPPPIKYIKPTPKQTRPPPVKYQYITPTPRKISNDQACRTMAVKAGDNNICTTYTNCCKQHCNPSGPFHTKCQYKDVGTVVFDNVNTFCHCY